MDRNSFENLLDGVCKTLTLHARKTGFSTAKLFEDRVRTELSALAPNGTIIDFDPHPQAFPDIALGEYGIEVKFSLTDTWRSVANSVLERNRIEAVKYVYIVFGKMGGTPEVAWSDYEKSVVHVRTSHVPRFEVELFSERSLFAQMGVTYDAFRELPMHEKMEHIRIYARKRLKKGERLWWLDDGSDNSAEFSLPIAARLYTKLEKSEKDTLRAEAALLCPQIVKSGTSRDKYDDVALYLLTRHGVLCRQTRDLFSAGSVANPVNDDAGGRYIERALRLLEPHMRLAANHLSDELIMEYWEEAVAPAHRITRWLQMADKYATDWKPSQTLFK